MSGIDWPGLLKWSLQYTDTPNNVRARPKEDLEFLEKAIRIALGNAPDYNKICLEALERLKSEKAEDRLAALGVIQECLDMDPELARNLTKFPEGVRSMLNCVGDGDTMIAEEAARSLAFAVPNNPDLQEFVWTNKGLEILISRIESLLPSVLKQDNSDDRRLFALTYSCLNGLVKNHTKIEGCFVLNKRGIDITLQLLTDLKDSRLITKCASLLQHLIISNTITSETYSLGDIDVAVAAAISNPAHNDNIQCSEIIAQLSLSMAQMFPIDTLKLVTPAINRKLKLLKDQPDREYERDTLQKALSLMAA
eukprot:Gregarina_sp_Poly_1__3834@NODE_2142_length_2611_cov_31_959119_g1380_i0_p1_GENE_NODE_2142_length_2611_cov_31_959119_g1380_i0NODE_2142_length_2611_cov_31_959119_g1380_i0_p1_ORF_typecomplete_len309_score52_60SIL1/PF16782_5/3_1e03SIL1/PF16782_5/6_7e07Proteasom_PSMB/PF10508_9/0_058Proteasom_PSMB/PF10508_9/8_9e02IFRD/PF05004_13/0_074IFRD/PF05004_13/2e02Neurochondrin/PF05536_11/0_18HEAT_2/PF13646_6/0_15HEAT_2/PF13646_6/2e03HEAT_2/PF13646_6/1_8e04LEDGF/PF11467_8/21LEDGF/PF11467_8/39_NODE_2142_length_261